MKQVYPLSLLAFAAAAGALALPRVQQQQPPGSSSGDGGRCQVAGLDHLYRRHVKPKKQHEIKCLAKVWHLISRVG